MTTSNREMDYVVELLGQVLDEMSRKGMLSRGTARMIEDRLVQKIKEYRERRTKADPSMIT
jgi:hypothetical protein